MQSTRTLAAVAALAALLGACTGEPAVTATTAPATAAPATPTPTPAPTGPGPLGADGLADLVATVHGAPLDPAIPVVATPPDDVVEVVRSLTVAGSPARREARTNMDFAINADNAFRSRRVVADTLDDTFSEDGQSATGRVCLSAGATNRARGPEAMDFPVSDVFVARDAVAVVDDGAWRLQQYELVADEQGQPEPCAPDAMATAVEQAWNDYHEALEVYLSDQSNDAAAAELDRRRTDTVSVDEEAVVIRWDDVHNGLFIHEAAPGRAETTWCMDMSRDADAAVMLPGGPVAPDSEVRSGTWTRRSDGWVVAPVAQITTPTGAAAPLADAWERCGL